MIFTSQSGLIDPGRNADWDVWYVEHLRIMVSVKGIESAQRFKTTTPGYSPSLAMYSMESAAVFDDPYYLSIRGLGEFRELVDTRYYRRNLFAGLDLAPAIVAGQILLVWDAPAPRDIATRPVRAISSTPYGFSISTKPSIFSSVPVLSITSESGETSTTRARNTFTSCMIGPRDDSVAATLIIARSRYTAGTGVTFSTVMTFTSL